MGELTQEEKARLEYIGMLNAGELKCPRCGQDSMHPRPVRNARSRVDGLTLICSSCGTAEAMQDYTSPRGIMTKEGWAVQ